MDKLRKRFKKFKKMVKVMTTKKKPPDQEDVPLVHPARSTASNDHSPVPYIENCIQGKKYLDAVIKLISIQCKSCDEDPSLADEVERLYELLENKLFEVVKKTIMKVDGAVMAQAVRAIKEQTEEESKSSAEGSTAPNKIKPRNWLNKWIQCAETSVAERFSNISQSSTSGDSSSISQRFEDMIKICKTDLTEAVNNIKQYWSQDTKISTAYARQYHALMGSEIRSHLRNDLSEDESHFLLCWMQKHYPRQILNDPTISENIDTGDLGPLVEPCKLRKLESNYVNSAKINMENSMNTKLQNEVKAWKSGKEPKKMENYYNLQLQDITQEYLTKLEKAAEISERMYGKMRSNLSGVLEKFLFRYKDMVLQYISKKRKNFELIVVANINCSKMFRDLVDSNADTLKKQEVISGLQETENLGIEALLKCDVCRTVKNLFRKLSYEQDQQEVLSNVTEYLTAYLNSPPLKGLNSSSYKVVINMLHLIVVQGYIAQILEHPKRMKEKEKLRTAGTNMKKSAQLINKFFKEHKTEETWLFPSILLMANTIRSEDLQIILGNITELVNRYPDSFDHVATILYMKGNMEIPQARSVLAQVSSPAQPDNLNRPLFSPIRPWPRDWLSGTEKTNCWKRIKCFLGFISRVLCCDCMSDYLYEDCYI